MDEVITRRDRTAGIALLAVGLATSILPDFRLAGQPIEPYHMGMPWFVAGILLLTMNFASRPKPKLVRCGAAILFVMGLAGPFLANLIDQPLGA